MPEFHGYRLVQISDLHTDTGLTRAHLAEVVKLVNQQQPDLVAITGDFVSYHARPYAADMIHALSQLTPRDATVAVLGNHDYWSDAQVIRHVIRTSGIIELKNAHYTLRRSQATLHIAGVDDFWEGYACLEQVVQQLPTTGAAILLAHEPDFADVSAAVGRFDLQLSGHSHGGQIIVPYLGPVFRPPHGVKYPVGHYRVGEMSLYTNRGLGTAFLRVRLNCRAEITVFTLEAV